MSEPEEKIRRPPRVVAFIGLLLLLWGLVTALRIPGTIQSFLYRWQIMHTAAHLLARGIVEYAILYLLGMAGIAMGIGLLKFAPWARRGAAVLLLCYVVYWMLMPLLSSVLLVPHPTELINNQPLLSKMLKWVTAYFFEIIRYAILLLFLETRYVRSQWGEDGRPGLLTGSAERLRGWLPATLPHLEALITLMLFCWAGRHLFMLCQSVADNPTVNHAGILWFIFSKNYDIYYFLGYMAAGLGLFWRQQWARLVAVTVLAVVCIPRISSTFDLVINRLEYSKGLIPEDGIRLLSYVLGILLTITAPIIMIIFLTHSGSEMAGSTDKRQLASANDGDSGADKLPWTSANYKGKLR